MNICLQYQGLLQRKKHFAAKIYLTVLINIHHHLHVYTRPTSKGKFQQVDNGYK